MSGIAQVQARVAEIESRLSQLSAPPAPPAGFDLGAGQRAVDAGTTGRTDGGDEVARASVARAAGAAQQATVSRTATPGPTDGIDATRLAGRLPDAGKPWAGDIVRAAERHGIDAGLLAALVQHESGFDPRAVSHAGAIGLGQLMPGTAAGLGVDPHDPQQNLDGAARYLREQLDRFGTAELALAAYNAGPNRVAQAGGIPRITETQNYVQRVTSTWERYR